MGAELLIPLVVKVGIEAAYHLIKLSQQNRLPTEEEWQKLIALSQKKYEDYVGEPVKP